MTYDDERNEEQEKKESGLGESILRDAQDAVGKKLKDSALEHVKKTNNNTENKKSNTASNNSNAKSNNSSNNQQVSQPNSKENATSMNNAPDSLKKGMDAASNASSVGVNGSAVAGSAGTTAGSTAATAGSAAAGSTGVGIPLAIIIQLGDKAKKASENMKNMDDKSGKSSKSQKSGLFILAAILFFFFYMMSFVGTSIQFIMPGPIETYRESQFFPESNLKSNFTKKGYPTVQKVLDEYAGLEEYNGTVPVEDAAQVYCKLIDATIIDIFSSFCEETLKKYDKNILMKFITRDDLDRNDEKTKEEFLKQPYPYCKKNQEGRYYTIEEFLNGDIPSYEESSDKKSYLNDDVNYAEIISVLGMNSKFNFMSEDCTIEDFAQLLCSDNTKKYLYEFKAYPVYIYKQLIDKNGNPYYSDKAEDIIEYYYTFEIMPYGLRELFAIAEVEKFGQDIDFTNQTNYKMLDRRENYLRTYARTSEYILGPSYKESRSSNSIVYGEAGNRTTTGRSADFYIQDADNLGEEIELEEWDIEDKPQVTVKYEYDNTIKILDMFSYINQGTCRASQMKRGNGQYTIQQAGCIDCSYIMIAEYYLRQDIKVSEIASNTQMYTGNSFATSHFMATYNMTYYSSSYIPFDIDKCRSYIDMGMPLIFHIKGKWEYNGQVYHKSNNGHFLVIMGYDNNGLYVYDPGSTYNTKNGPIPYEAFNYVDEKYLRDPYIS